MEVEFFDRSGKVLLRTATAEPICGEAFCDACGDCLACYGDEECSRSEGKHRWIEYEDAE